MSFDYTSLAIREDLSDALERAWQRLSKPGSWWDGEQRIAIVAEARYASNCSLCIDRKAALSANMVQGKHKSLGILPAEVVDLVHRLSTDSARLSETWYHNVLKSGVSDCEYVEIVSVVNMLSALDTFDRAIGVPLKDLPIAFPGEPTQRRPASTVRENAWVPTVLPEDLTDDDPDPYTQFHAYNIQLALGLVPQEVINFFDLDTNMYLTEDEIADLNLERRAISRAQMELIASRGASTNGCHYCATCHTLHLHKLGQMAGKTYDLKAVLSGASVADDIEHGTLLIAFVDAVLGDSDDNLEQARDELYTVLGDAGLVVFNRGSKTIGDRVKQAIIFRVNNQSNCMTIA